MTSGVERVLHEHFFDGLALPDLSFVEQPGPVRNKLNPKPDPGAILQTLTGWTTRPGQTAWRLKWPSFIDTGLVRVMSRELHVCVLFTKIVCTPHCGICRRMPSHTALDIECKVELTAVLNLMLCYKRKAEIAVLIHNRAAPTMPANVNKRWSLNPVEC